MGQGISQSGCSLLCIWTLAGSVKNCLREQETGGVLSGGGGWAGEGGEKDRLCGIWRDIFIDLRAQVGALHPPHPHTDAPQHLRGGGWSNLI